ADRGVAPGARGDGRPTHGGDVRDDDAATGRLITVATRRRVWSPGAIRNGVGAADARDGRPGADPPLERVMTSRLLAALLALVLVPVPGCAAGDELIPERGGHVATPRIVEPTDA